ncbi:MAG: hypothetical protein HC860_13350 [Alkalinema sp. RU_4_3]|nr:hypothetical protein [Alkalinema sp. RU_4_3]
MKLTNAPLLHPHPSSIAAPIASDRPEVQRVCEEIRQVLQTLIIKYAVTNIQEEQMVSALALAQIRQNRDLWYRLTKLTSTVSFSALKRSIGGTVGAVFVEALRDSLR